MIKIISQVEMFLIGLVKIIDMPFVEHVMRITLITDGVIFVLLFFIILQIDSHRHKNNKPTIALGKKIKRLMISAIVIPFPIMFIAVNHQQTIFKKEHYEKTYHGIIEKIEHYPGDRGFPRIYVDNDWIYLGIFDESIAHHIHVGDSIVKDTGDIARVYDRVLIGK